MADESHGHPPAPAGGSAPPPPPESAARAGGPGPTGPGASATPPAEPPPGGAAATQPLEPLMQPPLSEPRPEGARGGLVAGVILIVLGIVFLGQVWGWFTLDNWWALFIFIPAAFAFASAWGAYRRHGGFSREATGPLTGGLVLSFVALMLLFDWDWGLLWPVFLVLVGLGMLLGWRSH